MHKPRLLQTYLPEGNLEGPRIMELSDSSIKAFVIPRLKINSVSSRTELKQPSLYLLINLSENQLYIGESENFLNRLRNHDQSKDFWDLAIAIVSSTNNLEKSDVKYLESLSVEKSKKESTFEILNRTIPVRNNVHEFKIHTLDAILEDLGLICESLGISIFESKKNSAEDARWSLTAKKSRAIAEYRGDKFVILSGSIIDKTYAPSWASAFPKAQIERDELLKTNGTDKGDVYEITSNIATRSPNHAGGIVSGRSINAWISWKNKDGKTMDQAIRRSEV